eukprot:274421_1
MNFCFCYSLFLFLLFIVLLFPSILIYAFSKAEFLAVVALILIGGTVIFALKEAHEDNVSQQTIAREAEKKPVDTIYNAIQFAEKHKRDGNNAYIQDKDYITALMHYKGALLKLKNEDIDSVKERHATVQFKHQNLLVNLHGNIALMYLKIGGAAAENYENCIKHCNEVFKYEEFNTKALLRKGEALMHLKRYAMAKSVFAYYLDNIDADHQEMRIKWSEADKKSKCNEVGPKEESVIIDIPAEQSSSVRQHGSVDEACIICMDGEKDHIIIPCGHICLCAECAKRKDSLHGKCPVCRSQYQSINKIYK